MNWLVLDIILELVGKWHKIDQVQGGERGKKQTALHKIEQQNSADFLQKTLMQQPAMFYGL